MNRYAALISAIILIAATACTPASTQSARSSAGATPLLPSAVAPAATPRAATPTVETTLAPNPLNVKVKMDDQLTASAVISATTGGSVSLKASDGSKITLSVPKDALLDDTKITLTPLAAVDGLPFSGGLVGAVQMAPEGLRLFQPATLTIESTKPTPGQGYNSVAFAYHENGQGLYLTPAQLEGKQIVIPVWHFSGSGAASGTADEIKTQQQRVPANPEDALNQNMADYLGQQHQLASQGKPTDPELEKRTLAFLREYYSTVIKSQLAVAAQDCEASKTIIPKALGWARSVALWGFDKELAAETNSVLQTLGDAIVNCYNKAYDKCVAEDDLGQIAEMTALLRQAALLSPAEGGGLVSRLDGSKIEKCGTLELKFNSTIVGDFPQAGGGGVMVLTSSVRAGVPLKLTAEKKSFEGSAPLEYLRFSIAGVPCLKAATPHGGVFKVSDLDPSYFFDPARKGKLDIRLKIDPGVTQETYSSTCPDVPFSLTDSLYTKFFEQIHSKEKAGDGYVIVNWTQAGNGTLARKSYQGPNPCGAGGTCKEDTTLELIHRAQ